MNDEITKFSMADDDDYDEYEEEVIDRDEEYDDGEEEYEDEEYDDGEEYEDEDYDGEEEYEDEDYDGDEEYDDGYDNQYYDDRLNQVLDELAELKRNMTPAVQQPQSPILPVQPHVMFGMPQGNDVVMYNEISRLRDELSRTQNSQAMHEELSRLKEDMERDKRQNEAQFLSEIKRLNERIEELQAPEKAKPSLGAANQNAGLLPEAQHSLPPKELGKLVGVSETLLKSTRDSDAHILADISELKNKLDKVVNPETDKAIAEIKESVKKLEESAQKLEQRPEPADYAEALEGINARVAELKDKMSEAGNNEPAGVLDQKLINKLARMKTDGNGVDLTEIMRSVYELKGMLGSSDSGRNELVNMALKAYTDLDLLHATIANSVDLRTKLEAVENFVSSVNAQDFITSDALTAYNIVLKELMDTPLDRAVFDSLNSFAQATGKITVNSSKKDAVNKYIAFAERTKREDVDGIMEFLPELVSAINDAEGSKNVAVLGGLRDEIQTMYDERAKADDADKHNIDAEIKALVSELTNLTVGDVVNYAPVMPLPTSDAVSFADGDSVSDRINVILNTVADISLALQTLPSQAAAPSEDDATAAVHGETESAENYGEAAVPANVAEDLDSLRNMLLALEAKVNVDGLLAEVQRSFASVSGRLANIENKLSSASVSAQEGEEEQFAAADYADDIAASVSSVDLSEQTNEIVDRISEKLDSELGEEVRNSVLGELNEIKDKLAEQELFVSQIADLRTDLLALPESLGSSAQFDKLYEDIVSQFDKLYDDITAVDGENNEKLNAALDELKNAIDSVAASDMSSTVLDGIVDFRTAYEENQALSAADRNKLLEDLAFVRAGVEQRLAAQADETVHNSDLAAQITALGESFGENVKALEEKIAALEVSETAANEQNGSLGEQMENLAASVDERFAIGEENALQILEGQQNTIAALDELKEKSAAVEEAVNSNALLFTESENAINENVNKVLELLMPQGDADGTNLYDEIMSISRRVDEIHSVYEKSSVSIRDSIAEIKEQIHLKELEQSLAATSVSEEERAKVLNEIADLRERMSELENSQQLQSDTVATQLDKISEQLTELVAAVPAEEEASADGIRAIAANIAEIKDKLSSDNADEDALNMQVLMSDVAEIKDKLSADAETVSDIVRMQDDLTFIRNQIEATIESVPEDDSINETLENENMSLIMDDIASIKEKLSSLDEYDTVAEILSLREDVKTARLLDNSDVAAELESLKGDLAELKADVTDIKAARSDGDAVVISGDGAPTSDEVNMLLGEIVSLRDEIQAYKDDVTNMVSSNQDDIAPATAVADENIAVILEELTGLHNDIDNIKLENLAEQAGEIEEVKAALTEIKDMISRRTTLPEEGASRDTAASNELNVVLDEIINVKDEFADLKAQWSEMTETAAAERESDAAAEKAALADGLQSLKSELFSMIGEKIDELSLMSPDFTEELQSVKDRLADLQAVSVGNAVSEDSGAGVGGMLLDEIAEIKQMLAEKPEPAAARPESAVSIEELYGEVLALREELQESRNAAVAPAQEGGVSVDLTPVSEQLAEIRAALAEMPTANTEAAPDEAVLGEVLSLREEIAALKEQIADMNASAAPVQSEPDTMVLGEVLSLREEITALKEQLAANNAQESESERDGALMGEILGLREEIERMREEKSAAPDYEASGLMESIGSIREDVRSIKDEPDLSIINEVLALRDEFQAFKDELNKTRTAPAEDKSKDELIAEVQSLRDQLFAISMANVNDGTSNEVVYESYNNIILDEISSLRDEIALIKQSDETRALGEEISVMKDKLTNLAVDDSEKTEARFEELRAEIAKLKSDENDASNNAILSELAALKDDLDRRREAEELTQNFMSEMARILERQNAYLGSASNDRLAGEIESLKTEIASSLAVPATSEDLKSEIESLKAELGRSRSEAVTVDNAEVLREIAALKNEISKHNSSDDGKKILSEISRLKAEIGTMSDREQNDDGALSRSINDLKAELNQLAGIVDEKDEPAPAAKNEAQPKTPRKRGPKPGTKRKSPSKVKKQPPVNADNGLTSESLLSKIDSTSFNLGGSSSDETIVLNPNFEPEPIPSTSEEMDIAAKIAKQVANKLIMEQLVQQLGDGSVPHSEVEEIVKDILPQEFTTIQVDEQTDKVRRLANSLVLDKLRSRLKK